jgi:hypothetical protein
MSITREGVQEYTEQLVEKLNATDRLGGGTDGSLGVRIESGSLTWTRKAIIACEILFVLALLFMGEVIYQHKTAINISQNIVHQVDALLYLIIAIFCLTLLTSDVYIPYSGMFLILIIILLYFIFNCIWLVKAGVTDLNPLTYTFLLIASLTSLIPLFIIEYNDSMNNEDGKTLSSLLIILYALGSMIGGALMIWDPDFMTEYLYNTLNFSKDNKGNKSLDDYSHVFMWLSTLTMIVIIPIINILAKGTTAKYSIYFLVIVNFFIFIFSFYLLIKTKKLFSTATDTKIINVTLVLLSIGIFALVVGTALTIKNARSVTGDMDMPMICTKLGICCIACAQFLIGYYLYLPYVTPPSTNE